MPSARQLVRVGPVELCAQTFGDAADPAILLIGGAAMSMDWWREGFCARLAAGARFVVRYDARDTGASTTCPPGAPDYSGADLAADAAGLLAALGIECAHLAGISMGGALAQRLALERPDVVSALTLMSTSFAVGGPDGLPPPSPALRATFTDPPPDPEWSDRAAVIDWLIDGERPYAGSIARDAAELRALVATIVDRSRDIAAAANHWALPDGPPLRGRLEDVRAPTLVLHGTEDPLFPPAHGEALAQAIPGARLLLLTGAGHEVPPPTTWDQVVPAMLALS